MIPIDTLRKLRELEFKLGGPHTDRMYRRKSHLRRKQLIFRTLSRLKTPATILDFGCAEGDYCAFLRTQFPAANIVGCDLARNKLNVARKRVPGVLFLEPDALGVRQFDLVCCFETLQHIPDYHPVMKDLVRRLRPDGRLVMTVPNLSTTRGSHKFALMPRKMTVRGLLNEVGGAGYGRQNAFWKFDTHRLYCKDFLEWYSLKIVECVPVATPDLKINNLWTIGVFVVASSPVDNS